MARTPTPVAVQHLVDSLRALGEAPAKGQPRRIDDLEARLLRAIERDLAGLPIPDGYPTGNVGGGRGAPGAAADTSVEAAVIGRDDERRVRDRHHELTIRAVGAVDDAVVGVQVAFAALASIDDLIKTDGPRRKTCDHCTNKRGNGGNRPIYVRGTVGDRLERAIGLCQACYGFVTQTAAAGSRAGYLPSDEQLRQHEETGRWRIRVSGRPHRKT